ncbi:unnamed protein product [Owenia fusiformis]|uniref:Innexin n=1 Tax=Owenia fusiformis TaxID=6347 RepID=A0A8J1Y9V7_OWEFU|nr:unnamed protein product [Owenia fusiformis]
MGSFIYALTRFTQSVRHDDDFVDRLNYRYTAVILVVFALLVSGKQYVGAPIHCWCPAKFTDAHVNFANSLCWVKNTYYVPVGEMLPLEDEPRRKKELGYYQWVPIVLLAQAVLFYIPCIVWRMLNDKSGINVNTIVQTVTDIHHLNPDIRDKTIQYLVRHMDRCFDSQREYRAGCCVKFRQNLATKCCLVCGRRYGNYLVSLYLLIKVFYFANAVGQLFLLNSFIGTNYTLYGLEVVRDLINGTDWTESARFPRVTLCDFKIREFGLNIHRYTLQCVLPINLFNEKIYIFLWFWLLFIAAASAISTFHWIVTLCAGNKIMYVKKHLKLMMRYDKATEKKVVPKFTNTYLKQDGIFVLRLLGKNANEVIVSEIVAGLWDYYKQHRRGHIDQDLGTEQLTL